MRPFPFLVEVPYGNTCVFLKKDGCAMNFGIRPTVLLYRIYVIILRKLREKTAKICENFAVFCLFFSVFLGVFCDYLAFSMEALAFSTTFSTVKPKWGNSTPAGAEAPNVCMPISTFTLSAYLPVILR